MQNTQNDPIRQILDIEEIKQLKGRYCLCVATEDWKTFESLFTEDLQFITPSDGVVHEPRSEFMKFHKKSLQDPKAWGVVHCYTPIISITGPDTATGIWGMEDVHVYPGSNPRPDDPPIGHHGYGFYHEEYVRLAEGWRFKKIKVVYQRMDPLEGGFYRPPC